MYNSQLYISYTTCQVSETEGTEFIEFLPTPLLWFSTYHALMLPFLFESECFHSGKSSGLIPAHP